MGLLHTGPPWNDKEDENSQHKNERQEERD